MACESRAVLGLLDLFVCPTGDTDTLYISNLPLRCGALELRRIFEEVGEVKDCRIVNNPVSRYDPTIGRLWFLFW